MPARTEGTAIASLACGIGGLLFLPLILSIVAIVLGSGARKRIRESNGALTGDSMALAGIVTGWIGVAWGVLLGFIIVTAVNRFDFGPDFSPDISNFGLMLPMLPLRLRCR